MNLELSPRTQQRIQKIYQHPFFYDHLFKRVLDKGRREATRALPEKRPIKVLEIGVGSGLSFRHYPPDVDLTGVDPSAAMLRKAAKRVISTSARITLEQMDGAHLAFPDQSFDAVLLLYVVTVAPDPRALLHEARRVLRPGGIAIVASHFQGGVPIIRKLTFLTKHIGYHTLTKPEVVTEAPGWTVLRNKRVGLIRMIVLQK